jgi:hypothetical protein
MKMCVDDPAEYIFVCRLCDEKFVRADRLKRHENSHENKRKKQLFSGNERSSCPRNGPVSASPTSPETDQNNIDNNSFPEQFATDFTPNQDSPSSNHKMPQIYSANNQVGVQQGHSILQVDRNTSINSSLQSIVTNAPSSSSDFTISSRSTDDHSENRKTNDEKYLPGYRTIDDMLKSGDGSIIEPFCRPQVQQSKRSTSPPKKLSESGSQSGFKILQLISSNAKPTLYNNQLAFTWDIDDGSARNPRKVIHVVGAQPDRVVSI